MDSAIIIAIVSLIGTVIGTLVTSISQYRKDHAEIKKVELEADKQEITTVTNIADLVLKMYKQEIETIREISEDYKKRAAYLQEQLVLKELEIENKNKQLRDIEEKLRQCIRDRNITADKLEETLDVLNCKQPKGE